MQTISAEEFKKKYGTVGLAKMQQIPKKESGYSRLTNKVGDYAARSISEAYQGSKAYKEQGQAQMRNARGVGDYLEGTGKMLAGSVGALFSPLAPTIGKGIEKTVQGVSEPISNIPGVQRFSQTQTGRTTERVAENIGNVATVAGTALAPLAGGSVPKPNIKMPNIPRPNIKPPGILAKSGRVLKRAGETSYGVTVEESPATARAVASYKEKTPTLIARIKNTVKGETKGRPITEANTAARYGLIGTEKEIGVQAGRHMNKVWTEKIQPRLKGTKGKLDIKKFFNAVEKEIKDTTPELGRRNALIEGLDSMREEYGKVSKVGLEKLQSYKEGWAKTLPESYYKRKNIASALKEVKSVAANKAREFIYKNAGEDIKQDYIDYGNLKAIKESGIKSGVGDPAKKSISRGAWQFVMDKAVTPIATTMGKILYRTGEGLEFIGEPGAKTVGDIVGKEPSVSPTNKSIPNKQGGFVNFEEIAKSIDNIDKDIMLGFIDIVNRGKTPPKDILFKAQSLADTMGLDSRFSTNKTLAKDFNAILDLERKNVKESLK